MSKEFERQLKQAMKSMGSGSIPTTDYSMGETFSTSEIKYPKAREYPGFTPPDSGITRDFSGRKYEPFAMTASKSWSDIRLQRTRMGGDAEDAEDGGDGEDENQNPAPAPSSPLPTSGSGSQTTGGGRGRRKSTRPTYVATGRGRKTPAQSGPPTYVATGRGKLKPVKTPKEGSLSRDPDSGEVMWDPNKDFTAGDARVLISEGAREGVRAVGRGLRSGASKVARSVKGRVGKGAGQSSQMDDVTGFTDPFDPFA
jgi:hypothetical protein